VADNLEQYYKIGEEVVCFDDRQDLVEKVRYYLEHEQERAAIAQAGFDRTLRDHTYARRFTEIFTRMGLPGTEVYSGADRGSPPGCTIEMR